MRFRVLLTVLLTVTLGSHRPVSCSGTDKVPPSDINPECNVLKEPRDPNITPPRLIEGRWPEEPRDGSGDSKVWVMIRVDVEGRVGETVLCYTSNSTYAFKVMNAVRKFRYRPATLAGKPVEYRLLIVTTRKLRYN